MDEYKIDLIRNVADLKKFIENLPDDFVIKLKRLGKRGHTQPIFQTVKEDQEEFLEISE